MEVKLLLVLVFTVHLVCADYYSFDGSGNNLNHPTWGLVGSEVVRDLPTIGFNYADDLGAIREDLPNARRVSNELFALKPTNPFSSVNVNDLHTTWGFYMAHDIGRQGSSSTERTVVPVPYTDTYLNPLALNSTELSQAKLSITMTRKNGTVPTAEKPRNQFYISTPYFDLQTFYGMKKSGEDSFRVMNESTPGLLKTSAGNNLPLNAGGSYFNGDNIMSQYPNAAVLSTLWLREHNRLARKLSQENPDWNDEKVFQEAKRWNIAFYQGITYNEYISATTSLPPPPYTGYNDTLLPGTTALWVSAVCRYGHTEINSIIHALGPDWKPTENGDAVLRDNWGKQALLVNRWGIDAMLRGLLDSLQQEVDLYYEDEVRNFGLSYPKGIDAGTWTVQRGRDYGLPSYNDIREAFGLARKENFSDITANVVVQQKLKALYNETDNIDFFVGALAEDHPGLHMGETMSAAFVNQLMRSIHSDRLFYKASTSGFTAEEIAEIDNTKLSDLILRNFPDVPAVQCSAFFSSKTKDCGVVNDTCGSKPDTEVQEVSLLDGKYKLQWMLTDSETVQFVVTVQTTGWVAVGFSAQTPGRMVGSDVVAGWDAGSTTSVDDYMITMKSECSGGQGVCKDTEQGGANNLIDASVVESNGLTILTFSRKLDTGDDMDVKLSVNADIPIVAAFGDSDGPLTYHGQNKVVSTIRIKSDGSGAATTGAGTTGQPAVTTTGAATTGDKESSGSSVVTLSFAVFCFVLSFLL